MVAIFTCYNSIISLHFIYSLFENIFKNSQANALQIKIETLAQAPKLLNCPSAKHFLFGEFYGSEPFWSYQNLKIENLIEPEVYLNLNWTDLS